ncbi:MAG: restriction endonuclease subunit S [Alphaproteobacteria bacterium]|nr:restriction endonuclease subunit S [Alphaproteobacteria bacterium]
MTDSSLLLGRLPAGWENCQFGDLCNCVKDAYTPAKGGKTPYVGLEHFSHGFPTLVGCGAESQVKSSKAAFKVGDVLFGKLNPDLRKAVQADFNGVCSTDILVFRAEKKCDSEFLKYLVHSDGFMDHAESTASGIGRPRTSWTFLKMFRLSLPPLSEQKKIARALSTVQRAIEAQEQIIQTASELFRVTLHQLMNAQIKRGPRLWGKCFISDSFVKTKIGRQHKIPAKNIAATGQYPVIDQGQNFIAGYCDDADKSIDFDLPLVIFGDHTRRFKYVDFPFVLGADGTKVLVPKKELYDPLFYYYALLSLDIPNRGYNRHFLSIKGREIPLPPIGEQKKIAKMLAIVDKKLENARSKKARLHELFRALLHNLMRAKLRV